MTARPTDYSQYSQIKAINWSTLKYMGESPKHYRHAVDSTESTDTASRGMLRAIHCLVLEPDVFGSTFAITDMRRDKRTKVYQEFMSLHEGKTMLTVKEHDEAQQVASAVRSDPVAMRYLGHPAARFEQVIRWECSVTGLPCKGIADLLIIDGDEAIVIDLKTLRSNAIRSVARDIASMGFHGQIAGHYADGVRVSYGVDRVRCGILAVESNAPHDVTMVWLSEDEAWAGECLRNGHMERLAECMASGEWPGRHPEEVEGAGLPAYAFPPESTDGGASFTVTYDNNREQ